MFEEEMTVINQALIAATILDAETISLSQLQRSAVPPTVKTYFKSEVEQWLKNERAAVFTAKRFNYHLSEIQSLQQQIDMFLISRFVFEREDFLATLDKAIHFYFNYLLRPEWTLINFLYDRKSSESVQEIIFKLKYCSEYLYFNDILQQYFIEKGLVSIRVDEFRLLLQKIDDRVVQSHNSIELARLTTPIFDFINFGKTHPNDEVTIDALIVFFDDKRLDAIRARLEKEKILRGVQAISVWQLATLIEKVRSGNEDAVVEMGQPAAKHAEQIEPSPPLETPGGTEEEPAAEEKLSVSPAPPAPEPSTDSGQPAEEIMMQTPTPPVVSPQIRKSIKIFDEESGLEKKEPKLADLRRAIDPAEQKKITKKIFKKNEVEFTAAILKLNKMLTWKEAAAFLDEIFIMNDIDPDSRDAMRFADLVYKRYPEARGK